MKKKYESPDMIISLIEAADVLTASPGSETPSVEESDGIWDLDIG